MTRIADRSSLTAPEYLAWEREQESKVQVEHYRRREGNHWDYCSYGPGEHVRLTNGAELELDSIFDGVFALPGD